MASNPQLAHLNSMLRAYRDAPELSRAMTLHLLSLDNSDQVDFALALIMELCAQRTLKRKELPA